MTSSTQTSLPLMEHFCTLQGEGRYTGQASYFLRLGGCDVGCVWCDVKESWDATQHPQVSIEEMVDRVLESGVRIAPSKAKMFGSRMSWINLWQRRP